MILLLFLETLGGRPESVWRVGHWPAGFRLSTPALVTGRLKFWVHARLSAHAQPSEQSFESSRICRNVTECRFVHQIFFHPPMAFREYPLKPQRHQRKHPREWHNRYKSNSTAGVVQVKANLKWKRRRWHTAKCSVTQFSNCSQSNYDCLWASEWSKRVRW